MSEEQQVQLDRFSEELLKLLKPRSAESLGESLSLYGFAVEEFRLPAPDSSEGARAEPAAPPAAPPDSPEA